MVVLPVARLFSPIDKRGTHDCEVFIFQDLLYSVNTLWYTYLLISWLSCILFSLWAWDFLVHLCDIIVPFVVSCKNLHIVTEISLLHIVVFQSDTQAVMERFPVQLIREPTAFTSHDPMEIYNNILVFIVGGEERSQRSGSRSEMHIFQASVLQAKVINFVWPVLKVLT